MLVDNTEEYYHIRPSFVQIKSTLLFINLYNYIQKYYTKEKDSRRKLCFHIFKVIFFLLCWSFVSFSVTGELKTYFKNTILNFFSLLLVDIFLTSILFIEPFHFIKKRKKEAPSTSTAEDLLIIIFTLGIPIVYSVKIISYLRMLVPDFNSIYLSRKCGSLDIILYSVKIIIFVVELRSVIFQRSWTENFRFILSLRRVTVRYLFNRLYSILVLFTLIVSSICLITRFTQEDCNFKWINWY